VTQYRVGETTESIFKRVDELLYDAKEQGRDRVISDAA
jgi:PleD family two-component response regulator